MSRTYRFKHDEYIIKESLYDWEPWPDYMYRWQKIYLDPKSEQGKKKIARVRMGKYIMKWRGPAWFIRDYVQVPYRQRARTEIHKYIHGKVEDVVLESKPHREYYL